MTSMADGRPVTGVDHLAKDVLIHCGLVFAGHLDVDRLRKAASQITEVYPELNINARRRWWPLGLWYTAPATSPAWTFQHRDIPDTMLDQVFAAAAKAEGMDVSAATSPTSLGTTKFVEMRELFSFDCPSPTAHGWWDLPILNFRATRLGTPEHGHTLLTLALPHVITDANGVAVILETFGKLYQGENVPVKQPEAEPELLKLVESAMPKREGDAKVEEINLGHARGVCNFLSFCWQMKTHQDKGLDDHYLHVPRILLEKYRDQARALSPNDRGDLQVSRFDIFCAIIMKLIAHSGLTLDKSQPFDMYTVYSMLRSFPENSLPTPYLHNLMATGYSTFSSCLDVQSMPIPQIAVKLRQRLNVIRQPHVVHQWIVRRDQNAAGLTDIPWLGSQRGWAMVTSWQAIDEKVREAFSKENLLFMCPQNHNPGDTILANTAWPFGDGKGGIFARVSTMKGDWESMWQKAGMDHLQ